MKLSRNDKGIALVLVMVLSLIALSFVAALLYMVTQGTKMSGAYRFFKSAEDAGFGGTEIVQDYMTFKGDMDLAGLGISTGGACRCDTNNDGDATVDDYVDNATMARSCRCDKICNSTANWGPICTAPDRSLDPTISPEPNLTFRLGGKYDVFAKIVDTVEGNSDMGGLVTGGGSLGGAGVVASNTGVVTPPQTPYLYRIELQSQDKDNPRERSRLSLLYAY